VRVFDVSNELGQTKRKVFEFDALDGSLLKFLFLSRETERARHWLCVQVWLIRRALMECEI